MHGSAPDFLSFSFLKKSLCEKWHIEGTCELLYGLMTIVQQYLTNIRRDFYWWSTATTISVTNTLGQGRQDMPMLFESRENWGLVWDPV